MDRLGGDRVCPTVVERGMISLSCGPAGSRARGSPTFQLSKLLCAQEGPYEYCNASEGSKDEPLTTEHLSKERQFGLGSTHKRA